MKLFLLALVLFSGSVRAATFENINKLERDSLALSMEMTMHPSKYGVDDTGADCRFNYTAAFREDGQWIKLDQFSVGGLSTSVSLHKKTQSDNLLSYAEYKDELGSVTKVYTAHNTRLVIMFVLNANGTYRRVGMNADEKMLYCNVKQERL